jgi:prespore-specific regulator
VDKPLSQGQPKPLGAAFGLLIGLYEDAEETDLEREVMLNHLQALIAEVKRLQAIESDYIALREIMDRARKLAFLQAEEEETGPRFKMDANGNLTRINE